MTDLVDHLTETPPEGVDPPQFDDESGYGPWRIEHDKVASWALRRLAAGEAEKGRIKNAAGEELARIVDWQAAQLAKVQRDIDFFQHALAEYLLDLRSRLEDPDLKTYQLPTGKITARKLPDKVVVVDEDLFIGWALENYPDLVRVVPEKLEVDKVAVKKMTVHKDGVSLILDTGERAMGVENERGGEKITAVPS